PFSLRPEIRLVRSIPVRLPSIPVEVDAPLRVLLVPSALSGQRVGEQTADLEKVIRSNNLAVEISGPTVGALRDRLRQWVPHIVPYIGRTVQSRGEPSLLLGENPRTFEWVPATFARMLPPTAQLLAGSAPYPAAQSDHAEQVGLLRFAQGPLETRLPTVVVDT